MELTTFWFITIAVLWVGYFVLEGFDFGVGVLLKTVAKTQAERRAVLTSCRRCDICSFSRVVRNFV
jgi:cytochrome d ubiquinol oxidase subunit II